MKKSILAFMIFSLVLLGLMVSCNADMTHSSEKLVSVSFEKDSAKALTSTLPSFDVNSYYWYYAAQKDDNSLLCSGATASFDAAGAVAVNGGNKGLAIVSGFSQGYWNFKLFAYKDANKNGMVYSGTSENVLLKSSSVNSTSSNAVSVIVSPLTNSDKGTLSFDIDSIIEPNTNYTGEINIGYVLRVNGNETVTMNGVTQNTSYEVEPGIYTVKIKFDLNDSPSVTSTLIVTVYSNLTTTVSGSITGVVSTT